MRRVALLIGVEKYRDPLIVPLQFAAADVLDLEQRLLERCGFDVVTVLTDAPGYATPDLHNVLQALDETMAELCREDLFLFYFSGHGIEKDGRGYLLVHDSSLARPKLMSLSKEVLHDSLTSIRARQRILFFDACRTAPGADKGAASNSMEAGVARDIVAAAQAVSEPDATTALLSACKEGERAFEWPKWGHGVFTHFLLEGLDGEAWNGESLDMRGLASYTVQRVREFTTRAPGIMSPQTPWYQEFGGAAPILLARTSAANPVKPKAHLPDAQGALSQPPESLDRYPKVIQDLFRAAQAGDPVAQCTLGFEYDSGRTIPKNEVEAARWYRKAAEQGQLQAIYNLGISFDNGCGVPLDKREAVSWFRKAALQGHAAAQHALGLCYAMGDGVSFDQNEALRWWRKSALQENGDAQRCLGYAYYIGDGVAEDKEEAVRWYRKAADGGNPGGQNLLGVAYEEGEGGLPLDKLEAVDWYRKAAEQNDADGQYNLGRCHEFGIGVSPNGTEAVMWYRKAAEHGSQEAKAALARLGVN